MSKTSLNSPNLPSPQEERTQVSTTWFAWLPGILSSQCLSQGPDHGGFFQPGQSGWCDGRHAAYTLPRLMAARLWANELKLSQADVSKIDFACIAALDFIRRRQAPDGRLDLGGAYSPNEIGFPLTGMASAWARYRDAGLSPAPGYMADLATLLRKGAEAVLAGSAYTANHRWTAACAPLAAVHSLWPDPRYLARINDYLSDGIDVNADGSWHYERSPNYNGVATMGLLALLDSLPDLAGELLPPLRRHAEFLLHSLQPNQEADSTISHRQDRALPNRPASTYGAVRRLSQLFHDGRLTSLAGLLWQQNPSPEAEMVPLLLQLDSHPDPLPAPLALPDSYELHWTETEQIRLRSGSTLLSLASDAGGHFFDTVRDRWGGVRRSEDWIHLHHAGIVIDSLHLAGAGMRNLQPQTLRSLSPGHFQLSARQEGWEHPLHFRPGSPRIPMTWDWNTNIDVRRLPSTSSDATSFELRLSSATPTSLIAALNWWIRPGVTYWEGDGNPCQLQAGERYSLKGGDPLVLADDSSRTRIVIEGLPPAGHSVPIFPEPAIPSALPSHCAALSLGLRFPIDLTLTLSCS